MPRRLALTREMIAAAFPAPIPDDGWTIPVRDDAELERLLSIELEGCPEQGGLWLFAYGSLMWKPDIVFDAVSPAIVDRLAAPFLPLAAAVPRCRERPDLMLALVQGGSCAGLVYRLEGKMS